MNTYSGNNVIKQYYLIINILKINIGGVLLQLKKALFGTILNKKVHN